MPKDFTHTPADGATCPVQYGAICWRMHRGKVEVLLITSRDTGRWVIPKGWPMLDKCPASTAQQEAWEEAGVKGDVAEDSVGTFGYDKVLKPGQSLPCRVAVYSLRVGELKRKYPEDKMRSRKWFKYSKAARLVAEPELRGLLMALPVLLDIEPAVA
ncbi:NUDIX hydrolase [Fuscibacter oryzae]|nr:NUDIX hydrolase [Fuscibacter oryzae]